MSNKLKNDLKILYDHLVSTKKLGHATAREYIDIVQSFGGVIEVVPPEASATKVFYWFFSRFGFLSDFISKVAYFAVLSSTINLLPTLEKLGCDRVGDLHKKSFVFDSPEVLKESSRALRAVSQCFILEFGFA